MAGLVVPARWRAGVTAALAALLPLFAAPSAQAEAAAPSVVKSVIYVDAIPLRNSCNGDETVLHGELTLLTTHIPTRDGGEIVQGNAVATNLTGDGLPSGLTYRAAQVEISFAHYLAPEQGGFTATDVMLWLLVPSGNAQSMYLATVIRDTVRGDGTESVSLDKTYLLCR